MLAPQALKLKAPVQTSSEFGCPVTDVGLMMNLYENPTGTTCFFWHYSTRHAIISYHTRTHARLSTTFPSPLSLDSARIYDNSILPFTMLASLFKSILYLIPQLAAQSVSLAVSTSLGQP